MKASRLSSVPSLDKGIQAGPNSKRHLKGGGEACKFAEHEALWWRAQGILFAYSGVPSPRRFFTKAICLATAAVWRVPTNTLCQPESTFAPGTLMDLPRTLPTLGDDVRPRLGIYRFGMFAPFIASGHCTATLCPKALPLRKYGLRVTQAIPTRASDI